MDRGAWQATQRVRVCKESGMTEQLSLTHSAFFMVQLSHPYVTTGKTMALIIWTFVDKVMSMLFNLLSRFVIAFPPRRETSVRSLGWEDALEKEMATHSSILAWEIP